MRRCFSLDRIKFQKWVSYENEDEFEKGSEWGIWALQVQTILDDCYVSLEDYYQELKKTDPLTSPPKTPISNCMT